MCIESLRSLRAQQALAILSALEAAGRDVVVKRRADGWHVVSESATAGDYQHRGESLVDALGQLTTALALDQGIDLGSSRLDELDPEDADAVRVDLEPVVEFATPLDPQDDEWSYAYARTTARDTEPPSRLYCVFDGCDQEPEHEGLCIVHLHEQRRVAELEASMGIAVGDAE